ncbi:MAG: 2-oxoglutarate dehydrogenase complex dihydrolipoyllysine-residue succinyltransferase, partial [Planctomycetota bacterium]
GHWHKAAGEWVEKDETLVEIESDKVTLEVSAPASGLVAINAEEGQEARVGDVIGSIDTSAERPARAASKEAEPASATAAAPAPATETPPTVEAAAGDGSGRATSVARKVAADKGLDLAGIRGTGPSGRVTKADVLAAANGHGEEAQPRVAQPPPKPGERPVRRERMSRLRQRIAERLVEAQQTAALLTTFNEADMSAVIALRKQHKEAFEKAHGVGLGFMSFFVKACCSALAHYQRVNAFIDGDSIEYHDFVDMSIAVGTDKGLVVPVIRDAHAKSFAAIEKAVVDLATRARESKLSLEEMTGGTFTISNGGIYGSLLSTPILNPPQSGILGMHRILNRPVEDHGNPGQIVLRPMMNLALSYDHRIVDGEQAVTFLVHVKQVIEEPARLLLDF